MERNLVLRPSACYSNSWTQAYTSAPPHNYTRFFVSAGFQYTYFFHFCVILIKFYASLLFCVSRNQVFSFVTACNSPQLGLPVTHRGRCCCTESHSLAGGGSNTGVRGRVRARQCLALSCRTSCITVSPKHDYLISVNYPLINEL